MFSEREVRAHNLWFYEVNGMELDLIGTVQEESLYTVGMVKALQKEKYL